MSQLPWDHVRRGHKRSPEVSNPRTPDPSRHKRARQSSSPPVYHNTNKRKQSSHNNQRHQKGSSRQGNKRTFKIGFNYLRTTLLLDANVLAEQLLDDQEALQTLLNDPSLAAKTDWIDLVLKCMFKVLDMPGNPNTVILLGDKFIQTTFIGNTLVPIIGRCLGKAISDNEPADLEYVKIITEIFIRLLRRIPSSMKRIRGYVPILLQLQETKESDSSETTEESPYVSLQKSLVLLNKVYSAEPVQALEQKNEDPRCIDIINLPILPTEGEFLALRTRMHLTEMKSSYATLREYLYTHFTLMREDFIRPLLSGIKDYRDYTTKKRLARYRSQNAKLFQNVSCTDFDCKTHCGILFTLDFHDVTNRSRFKSHKALIAGNIILLSSDGFMNEFIPLVIAGRKDIDKFTCKGCIPIGDTYDGRQATLLMGKTFDILESSVYYEALRPVLQQMQTISGLSSHLEKPALSLARYIIKGDTKAKLPQYLLTDEEGIEKLNLQCLVSGIQEGNYTEVDPLVESTWPVADEFKLDDNACRMDSAQYNALKSAIMNEFALIQGPPGTGKTYIGLLLMKYLLNRQKPDSPPILLLCYTNHALDQFIDHLHNTGIINGQNDLIRVGSRSKSDLVSNKYSFRYARFHAFSTVERKCFEQQRHIIEKKHDIESARFAIIHEDNLLVDPEDKIFHHFIVDMYPGVGPHSLYHWLFSNQCESSAPTKAEVTNVSERESRSDIFEDEFELYADEDRLIEDLEEGEIMDAGINHNESANFDIRDFKETHDLSEHDLRQLKQYIMFQLQENTSMMDEKRVAGLRKKTNMRNVLGKMNNDDKWKLYRYWRKKYLKRLVSYVKSRLPEYMQMIQAYNEYSLRQTAHTLSRCKVLAFTTTGAAKHAAIMDIIKPEVVIVEEAAEILEGQLIAAIGQHCQHLIQIGDHKQLRPRTNVYQLTRKYKMDISLFERAVNSGIKHTLLETQHRMIPDISTLLVPSIYKELKNHESVNNRKKIRGLTKNVFFLNHDQYENIASDTQSHVNKHEAEFLAHFARYLTQQGYSYEVITILTAYSGQMFLIRDYLKRICTTENMIKVKTIDDYQGEENEIVLLSLVRSNVEGKIGFLATSNRICVAISRAKCGFYAMGNLEMLKNGSRTWTHILNKAKEMGSMGSSIILACERHPANTCAAAKPDDFLKVSEGGCHLKCGYRLSCGHTCRSTCHIEDRKHDNKFGWCNQICGKMCVKRHKCHRKCSECRNDGCKCAVKVEKVLPLCGHTEKVPCHVPQEEIKCAHACKLKLDCGHTCSRKCYEKCISASRCSEMIERKLPCGHLQHVKCNQSQHLDTVECKSPCGKPLPCEHACPGLCGTCYQSLHAKCIHKCGRSLICQHICKEPCTKACPSCTEQCNMVCIHGYCPKACGEPCDPCQENCSWSCPHHQCTKKCHETCDRDRCSKRCPEVIQINKCGHRQKCIGVCGEHCPQICTKCDKSELEEVDEMFSLHEDSRLPATYIQLLCGHYFETKWLDKWFETQTKSDETSGKMTLKQLSCPLQNCPVRYVYGRYGNKIKQMQRDIDIVKEKVYKEHYLLNNEDVDKVNSIRRMISSISGILAVHFNSGINFQDIKLKLFTRVCKLSLKSDAEDIGSMVSALRLFQKHCRLWDQVKSQVQITPGIEGETKISILKQDLRSIGRWIKNNDTTLKPFQATAFKYEMVMMTKRIQAASICFTLQNNSQLDDNISMVASFNIGYDKQKNINQNDLRKLDEFIERNKSCLPTVATVSEEDIKMVVKAMGFSRHWYKCRNGHVYVITECGGATEKSECPECGSRIGGDSHRLREDNSVATEMDGARHPAWSQHTDNLVNYGGLNDFH